MSADKFQFGVGELEAARRRISPYITKTPLLSSFPFSGLFFKCENLQRTGSFKLRTAYNQMLQLSQPQLQQGVVTSSSGNFGQAVACAAQQLKSSARIVMMEGANPLKVEKTRAWGGRVVFCLPRYSERAVVVERLRLKEGLAVLHPFDHPAAICGNASAGLEILEQLPTVKHIIVPVSGGGLIAGVALAARLHRPEIRIWGVQPAASNAACLSFQAGHRKKLKKQPETSADGLMVAVPGRITFPLIQAWVHELVAVQEDSILEAVRHLLQEAKLVVEPSGAVTLAAVLEGRVPVEQTVALLSGGNIAAALLMRLAEADSKDLSDS